MSDLPSVRSPSVITRAALAIRALLPSAARRPPPQGGISVGRVTSNRTASIELDHLGTSPTVYAAVTRRALTIARFPLRCYLGLDPKTATPIDPNGANNRWVRDLLTLLATPDPLDLGALFPANPGIRVWAQVIADLILSGDAFIAPTGTGEGVAGLTRIHPQGAELVRRQDGEFWRFGGSRGRLYPRRSVAHIRMLSAKSGGAGELGIGAASGLQDLLTAERLALQQTATKIQQGGVDLVVTGKTATTQSFLKNKKNREIIADRLAKSLGGEGKGRRIYIMGGDLDIKDAGFRPADLQAPEMLAITERKTLQSLGVVPIALGAEASTFATAVQQYRAQADMDAGLVALIESGLFQPLARQFALASGSPSWARRAAQVTCKYDLSSHPGNIYARSEAIDRAGKLITMGWSPEQAADAEGLELPPPAGVPDAARITSSTPTPGTGPAPAAPLGDTEPDNAEPADPARVAIVDSLRQLAAEGYQIEIAAK